MCAVSLSHKVKRYSIMLWLPLLDRTYLVFNNKKIHHVLNTKKITQASLFFPHILLNSDKCSQ